MQIVFQEPAQSFNPQLLIGEQIAEPLIVARRMSRRERRSRVAELLDTVGLSSWFAEALPSEVSGGELQRCSIARAIATTPKLLVLDEPTSALPPNTQAEILAVLAELQVRLGMSYVFISHDLLSVRELCHRVAVMYLGEIVEVGSCEEIFEDPQHPYTRALLASILRPEITHATNSSVENRLIGDIPSAIELPNGCFLSSRCPHAQTRCFRERQELRESASDHLVRCWRALNDDLPAYEERQMAS